MRAIPLALILAATLTLAGCAHKPGLGSYADAATTYSVLADGGTELNPVIGWSGNPLITAATSIVIKQGAKHLITAADVPPATSHRWVETGGMFGAGWNGAVLLGAAGVVPFIGGFGAALWYWVWGGEG